MGGKMITRIWHGRTKKEDAEIYRQLVIETGIKDYLKTEGNLGAQILQRDEGNEAHFYTVTQWKDYESIKSFAGENYNKPKYYPKDDKYLLEKEQGVKHYQTYTFSNFQIKNYIRQIEELYEGENWTDENFLKKFKNMKSDIAFVQPVPGKHSVSEVLWHCIYWRKVLIKRMEGDLEFGKATEAEQNFLSLDLLKKKGWKKLLAEFEDSNKSLLNFLKTKDDGFLEKEYQSGYTNKSVIEGIIAHDYYHLGQIGFIISLLNK